VDHAGCTCIFAKSGIADLKKLNICLDTYYFCQNYNFMFNLKVKLTRQQPRMSQICINPKIVIVVQGGDNGNGHSCLSQQPTMKLMALIHTRVLQRSAGQVSSVMIVVFSFGFSNLIQIAPQCPW
jgi:hypothetical protein